LGDFAELTDRERLVGNLHVAYAEQDGSGPVDVRSAIGEMIEYNDGKPLRCVA
jgi:cyclase